MKTFVLILGLLFSLAFGVFGSEDAAYIEQLLKNGQTVQVPVAKMEVDRSRHSVWFLLNGNLKHLPVSRTEYNLITLGDSMSVVYDPSTGHLMWPEDVTSSALRKKRQQKSASFLLMAVCGGWLLWRIKPRPVAQPEW
ncbi:hypothetical protein [Hymenobacter chitinivorans]|uniref:hypothetical protein n=1 Tax=Hymenobacter chitinivorans TaxID=89969 RepID=UPI000C242FB0|nr:hypothetical protein [Hymenobacter chitinivorans]